MKQKTVQTESSAPFLWLLSLQYPIIRRLTEKELPAASCPRPIGKGLARIKQFLQEISKSMQSISQGRSGADSNMDLEKNSPVFTGEWRSERDLNPRAAFDRLLP